MSVISFLALDEAKASRNGNGHRVRVRRAGRRAKGKFLEQAK